MNPALITLFSNEFGRERLTASALHHSRTYYFSSQSHTACYASSQEVSTPHGPFASKSCPSYLCSSGVLVSALHRWFCRSKSSACPILPPPFPVPSLHRDKHGPRPLQPTLQSTCGSANCHFDRSFFKVLAKGHFPINHRIFAKERSLPTLTPRHPTTVPSGQAHPLHPLGTERVDGPSL